MTDIAEDAATRAGRDDTPSGTRRRRAGLLAAAVAVFAATFASLALAAPSTLVQKPGTDGCISDDGTGGACADGEALGGAGGVTVSPDGKNAYVASTTSNAVAIFDRDPATGELTQKPGTAGCISAGGSGGACTSGTALGGAAEVAVSPDGKSAYVAGALAVAIFDRNTSTGALTQKPGTAGCISENGTSGAPNFTPGACVDGTALNGVFSFVVSPDGKSAYGASYYSDAVVIFDRDTSTGALTQKPGTAGCISDTGTGGACIRGLLMDGARSVAVSPDGKNAYAAAYFDDDVLIFDRDATTGALTQKAIPDGCISQTGSGDRCGNGEALDGARSVVISPDGKNAYAASFYGDSVTIFDRDQATGELTQKANPDGCISQTGSGGVCGDGEALNGAGAVTIWPDGENVYVASIPSNAVSAFARDTSTGNLTQDQTGPKPCISETGTGGHCIDGVGFEDVQSIAVSPDSNNAYTAAPSSSAVTVLDRDDGKVDGKASAAKTQKQKGKKIAVKVKVKAGEQLDAKVTGNITVKKKSYKLKKAKASIGANKTATLKLKPAEKPDAKKIAKGLKKSKGKAKLKVELSDVAANMSSSKLKVTLKS